MGLESPSSVDCAGHIRAREKGVQGFAEGEKPVMEAPHGQGGRVEKAVAIARGGQGPEPLTRPGLGPPVQATRLLQRDERGQLNQVLFQEASVVLWKKIEN